jgi:hypothetical protein
MKAFLKPCVVETEHLGAGIEVIRHDPTDNTVQVDVDGMWFAAEDAFEAAAFFASLGRKLARRTPTEE